MRLTIHPGNLSGCVAAVSSKSQAHRAIFLAAFADRSTRIICRGISEDIEASLRAVEMLGAGVTRDEDELLITPADRSRTIAEMKRFDCGESGTTLRFVLPMIGVRGMTVNIRTHGRLGSRPLKELGRELTKQGMIFDQTAIATEALGRLAAGRFELPGNVSSQYISALLMALPMLDGPSEIVIDGPVSSEGYIEMTLKMMEVFGVTVERTDYGFKIEPAGSYRSPGEITVEGDWSAAAFWLTARALGSDIEVAGLQTDSEQGDRAVEALLERVSAGDAEIDIDPTPDLLPALAVAAAVTEGRTHFVNASRLRAKESDRLETTAAMLRELGAVCEVKEDALIVQGSVKGTGGAADQTLCRLHGGEVNAAGDHRIAMSAAIAATVCDSEVTISGAESVAKSYPGFWEDYEALGGSVTTTEEESKESRDF